MAKLALNAERRNSIGNVIEEHFRNKDSIAKRNWDNAIQNYESNRPLIERLIETVVRMHQPQNDVDTIKTMISRYGDSGGNIYSDNCFYFTAPDYDEDGKRKEDDKSVHISFKLERDFAYSYFDKKIRDANLDPNNEHKYGNNTNPRYNQMQNDIGKFLGFRSSSNDDASKANIASQWDDKFRLEVIGTSYCHSRQFGVNETDFQVLNNFKIIQEQVVQTHEAFHDYIKSKMDKVRLGLKSYKYFDQAKELCDNLGIALNESILNEKSSLALSIYNPTALADILKDNDIENADKKASIIAKFKKGELNQAIN